MYGNKPEDARKEMGNRGSKSNKKKKPAELGIFFFLFVKEQRVDGIGHITLHVICLRCIL